MNFTRKCSLAASALIIISAGTFAQQVKKKPAATQKSKTTAAATSAATPGLLPMDPNVLTGKLANGLTYYIRKNTEPKNRAVLYLVGKAGSVIVNENL